MGEEDGLRRYSAVFSHDLQAAAEGPLDLTSAKAGFHIYRKAQSREARAIEGCHPARLTATQTPNET